MELKDAAGDSDHTPILILDRVFDDFVALEKENRLVVSLFLVDTLTCINET